MPETAAPPLAPLVDAPDELELRKESWKEETLDLMAGDTSYARIDYSIWSGKGKAQTADGSWVLSGRKGWKANRIEVTEGEDGPQVAELDLSTWSRGGEVDLSGAQYTIDADGWLKPEWACQRDGRTLLTLKETGSLRKKKATLHLTSEGREDPNLPLLVLLVLHAKAKTDEFASVGATVAAGSVASS